MRFALLLSGQARCLPACWPGIQEHLVQPLGCQVFFHFWDELDAPKLTENQVSVETRPAGLPLSEDPDTSAWIQQELRPVLFVVQKQVQFVSTSVPMNVLSMWYSMRCANEAKRRWEQHMGRRYDCVIRCRTDLMFANGFIQPCLDDLERVHCFRFGLPPSPYCNDLFGFGSSAVMDKYSDCYEYLSSPRGQREYVGPELALSRYLYEEQRVPVQFLDEWYDPIERGLMFRIAR